MSSVWLLFSSRQSPIYSIVFVDVVATTCFRKESANLGILHKVAFCSQPRVFLQDAEIFRPLTLRHPTRSRVKWQGDVDAPRAWVLGQVKPFNLHLLLVLQFRELNAFGISWVWRIKFLPIWATLLHLEAFGKLEKIREIREHLFDRCWVAAILVLSGRKDRCKDGK